MYNQSELTKNKAAHQNLLMNLQMDSRILPNLSEFIERILDLIIPFTLQTSLQPLIVSDMNTGQFPIGTNLHTANIHVSNVVHSRSTLALMIELA